MLSCPKCLKVIPNQVIECPSCTMDLTKAICSNCESILDLEADICDSCGNYMHRQFIIITTANLEDEQLINSRYRVLSAEDKIVKDTLANNHRFYAEQPKNIELLEIYKKLSKFPSVPKIYDAFHFQNNDYLIIQIQKDSYGQSFMNIREILIDTNDREKLQLLRDISELYRQFLPLGITSSLLNIEDLFIDENLNIKLNKLTKDTKESTLKDIFSLWEKIFLFTGISLIEYSKYKIVEIMRQIKDGRLSDINELLKKLDAYLETPLVSIEHSAGTDPGRRRTNNEDNFYAFTSEFKETGINRKYTGNKGLYILCDGMGGHDSGEVASAEAISAIRNHVLPALSFQIGFEEIRRLLEDAIVNKANENIFQLNETQNRKLEQRMGTTIVVSIVIDNKIYTAHVGDSRIYMVNKDKVEQLTEDHNVAMKNYKDGFGSYEDAIKQTSTRWGKVLTQALGPRSGDNIIPEINVFTIKEDGYIILCSDGLTDMVQLENIHEIVKLSWDNPKEVVSKLIDTANANGGKDNISVIASKICMKSQIFPPLDYSEILYDSELGMQDEIIEMVEPHEKSLEGINIEPDEEL